MDEKEKRYEFCCGSIMTLFDPEQGQGIKWITASSAAWKYYEDLQMSVSRKVKTKVEE